MKLKTTIILSLALILTCFIASILITNPTISTTTISGNCTSVDPANSSILLKGANGGIVTVPEEDMKLVNIGSTYLYVKYDRLRV